MWMAGLFKQKLLVPASLVHNGGLFPFDGVLVLVHVRYSATAKVAVVLPCMLSGAPSVLS